MRLVVGVIVAPGSGSRMTRSVFPQPDPWLRRTGSRSFHATRGGSTPPAVAGGGWGFNLPIAALPDHNQRLCGHASLGVGGQGEGQGHEDLVRAADLEFVALDGDGSADGAVPVGLGVGDHAVAGRAGRQEGPGDLRELTAVWLLVSVTTAVGVGVHRVRTAWPVRREPLDTPAYALSTLEEK